MFLSFTGGIRRMLEVRRTRRGGGLGTTSDTRSMPGDVDVDDVEFIRVKKALEFENTKRELAFVKRENDAFEAGAGAARAAAELREATIQRDLILMKREVAALKTGAAPGTAAASGLTSSAAGAASGATPAATGDGAASGAPPVAAPGAASSDASGPASATAGGKTSRKGMRRPSTYKKVSAYSRQDTGLSPESRRVGHALGQSLLRESRSFLLVQSGNTTGVQHRRINARRLGVSKMNAKGWMRW